MSRSCPQCHDDIEFHGRTQAVCPNCQDLFRIEHDGEFEDGMWHDCTTLTKVEKEAV